MQTSNYRQLNAERTIETLRTLKNRITERFGESSLANVAEELTAVAGETQAKIRWISRANVGLRLLILSIVVGCGALITYGVSELLRPEELELGLATTIGLVESAVNELILAGAALAFLFTIELRIKRTRALQALHELRAMAHVIDMHQLTKDPSQVLNPSAAPTASSPKREMTPYQLTRYLDYCSEMLSLIGKFAALYAQSLSDPVVVTAVNDIETLTNGLSRKVWQKIVMLDDVARVIQKDEPSKSSAPLKS